MSNKATTAPWSRTNKKPRRKFGFYIKTLEGTTRLETFTDGVFTIAATLLVVDLKIPHSSPDTAHLIHELTQQWPTYFSYALSFFYLGLYWTHHHHIFSFFRRTDPLFLKLNILFLMMVALLPFPTALLGAYMHLHDDRQRTVVLIYAALLLISSLLFVSIWLYATYKRRLVDDKIHDAQIRDLTARYVIAPISYASAFLVAFWNPTATLIIILLVALFYTLPFHMIDVDVEEARGP